MQTIPSGPRVRAWNTWKLARDPYRFYADNRERFGDTYWVRAINGDVLVSADSAVLRDLLRADTDQVRPFAIDAGLPLTGSNSVIALWGPRHREERKLLMPPFHGERMRAYGAVMRAAVDEATGSWREGQVVVAADAMLTVSLKVIVRAVFGVLEPERVERWTEAVRALVRELSPAVLFFPMIQRLPFGPWPRFVRARDALDALILSELRERRATGARGADILSMLLDARHDDGRAPNDVEIRDELVTLLFAGHETTQILMAWMLYHVARHDGVRARLVAELDATDGSPEALAKLPYLDAVVSESLRLMPIVPDMVRTTTVPLTLGPYQVPAGTHVGLVAALVHGREDLYPEPDRFRPERFLERSFKPHEYLPFGGGVRRCLGAALATWEAKVVVGTLLRRLSFDSLTEEKPRRRNVTMAPASGVVLRVHERPLRAVAPAA